MNYWLSAAIFFTACLRLVYVFLILREKQDISHNSSACMLPFKCGNNGGWNWVPSEARCGCKKIGGFERDELLSNIGRNPLVLENIKTIIKTF